MMFFSSKKKVLGLDIGTSTIKLAEIDPGRSPNLIGFAVMPTPPQSFVAGDVSNPQAISDAVRELVSKLKTKRTNIATGLGGTSIIVKRISIPKIEEKLIAEQIRWEAEQYIPYDVNEVNLGFEVLRKTSTGSDNMDILLVAAVQSHVFKYAEAVQMAGLNLAILDVAGFALANSFRSNYGELPGQSVAVMNIGASATTMIVVENTEVVFCRDIPVGGMTYSQDLQKGLNINFEEAEAIKISMGSGKAPQEAAAILQGTHEVVSDEIKASVDFYVNSSKTQKINRCFVTGGGSRTHGLIDRLSKIVPCEKFDPFFKVKASGKSFSPAYLDQIRDLAAISVGLGLRQVGDA